MLRTLQPSKHDLSFDNTLLKPNDGKFWPGQTLRISPEG
jgi:hypothetical protein